MSTFFWTLPAHNVKNLNKHAIIDLIRFTPSGVSRVDLARMLGLTRAAITAIVNDLLELKLVREVESHYPSGRRPIVLEINPDYGYVVGIDIGATHFTVLLANFAAQVVWDHEESIVISDGPAVILKKVDQVFAQMLAETGVSRQKIFAVGMGVPGPVVAGAGKVSAPPIMPGWDDFPIQDHCKSLWGYPVSVANDAELGAIGEWAYGAGRGVRNLAYIKVGTGIGSGLLLDGQVYRGSTGTAGEIGHITLDENGPLCTCGNRGCLEALAGGRAIAQKAIQAVQSGQRTQLSIIQPTSNLTAKDVLAAARNGDLVSQRIFVEAGVHLGTAIASLVNLFNPSMVVVGGSVAQIGDLLLEPIRKTVQLRSLRVSSQALRITTAILERRSSGIGAVVQALSIALHQIAE